MSAGKFAPGEWIEQLAETLPRLVEVQESYLHAGGARIPRRRKGQDAQRLQTLQRALAGRHPAVALRGVPVQVPADGQGRLGAGNVATGPGCRRSRAGSGAGRRRRWSSGSRSGVHRAPSRADGALSADCRKGGVLLPPVPGNPQKAETPVRQRCHGYRKNPAQSCGKEMALGDHGMAPLLITGWLHIGDHLHAGRSRRRRLLLSVIRSASRTVSWG